LGNRLEHDALVQLIYDCAENPRGLHDALEEIAHQVGAEKAHTLVIANGIDLVENHSYGYDAAEFARYDVDWRAKDPRFAAAELRPGELLSDVAVGDESAFERSEIYNDFLAKVDVRYTLFGNFRAGPNLLAAQSFMRSKRAGAFDAGDVERVQALLPHLCRAARLRHLVASMRSENDDLRRALDLGRAPLAVLDAGGRVVCANAAAKELLDERNGLRVERGLLTASRPNDQRALAAAIAKAALTADAGLRRPAPAHAPSTVAISRNDGVSVAVVLFSLHPESRLRGPSSRSGRALAVFHDPRRLVRLRPELVAEL
jgi:PAS domain-containing protein